MSSGKTAQPNDRQLQRTTELAAIQQLILRERRARDMQEWETLASCFTAESRVEMSWFKGSGALFAAESRKVAANGLLTFHEAGPALIDVAGDRAIADTPMAAHVIRELHGSEVDVTFWTRMRNRVERQPNHLQAALLLTGSTSPVFARAISTCPMCSRKAGTP